MNCKFCKAYQNTAYNLQVKNAELNKSNGKLQEKLRELELEIINLRNLIKKQEKLINLQEQLK